jgi:ribonuclease BN (tRNA processing enzyme)
MIGRSRQIDDAIDQPSLFRFCTRREYCLSGRQTPQTSFFRLRMIRLPRIPFLSLCRCAAHVIGAGVGLAAHGADADCGADGVAVQILGSGGPVASDRRASAGNLVWSNGRARVLVDSGGGVFLRFGESGAKLEDLSLIAITHLHADHVADLPALVKSGFFSDRESPLVVSGPGAGGDYPSIAQFLRAEFDPKHGAFRYLSGALDGSDGLFKLAPRVVAPSAATPVEVFASPDLRVVAVGVRHGPVPALAYRVDVGKARIVFSGDQDGSVAAFWTMARDADLLVMNHAVPEDADRVARNLHALPSTIGAGAAAAHVRRVVLSHLMARSVDALDRSLAIMRERYDGPIEVARDLACYRLSR